MRILSVVGARPQFVKLAPVERALGAIGLDHDTIHTGQHYDAAMSDRVFESLGINEPRWNLGIGSGNHGQQTAAMLQAIEQLLIDEDPAGVLVYGDTNSTLAAALAAVKIHTPVLHLEAGLRSFNRRMPEEHNRVLVDHASDLCLAPTPLAMRHLANEGLSERSVLVGDVMVDILLEVAGAEPPHDIDALRQAAGTSFGSPYALATIHRAENTDSISRLRSIVAALQRLDIPVLLPLHPRVKAIAEEHDLTLAGGSLHIMDPLNYTEMVHMVAQAESVITDSGGLQKEAFVLGIPTTTVREETEWPETLDNDWNVLSPDPSTIAPSVGRDRPTRERGSPYGTGSAADQVATAVKTFCEAV